MRKIKLHIIDKQHLPPSLPKYRVNSNHEVRFLASIEKTEKITGTTLLTPNLEKKFELECSTFKEKNQNRI